MLSGFTSGHKHSQTVMEAFCAGAGIPLLHVSDGLRDGGMATYGNMRGLKPLLDQCIAEGREWWYLDNGYINPGHWDGYFRVTRGSYMHDGSGDAKPDRWHRLGRVLMPWRRGGDYVLVCPPGQLYGQLRGFDSEQWLTDTLAALRGVTDRELRVRAKPVPGNAAILLADVLRGAHAVVCHSSNTAVDALLAGVPVFCTAPCAAYKMGIPDLRRIEAPYYPDDRERWAQVLAANQWRLDEMRDGACWKDLNERDLL